MPKPVDKPCSVPFRGVVIYLGCKSPYTSSDLPEATNGTGRPLPLLGLAADGVYRAAAVTNNAGALLPHPFTLTLPK